MPDSITNQKLFDIISDANSKFNLTSITSYEEFLTKHIKDSELGEEFVSGKVLDIGSGAGFPALVLKIDKPEIELTMIDSVGKKVNYLNETITKLGLTQAIAVHTRIEDLNKKEYFDTVTARAVASMATLVEYALPFLKIGGRLVAYKSNDIDEELRLAKNAIKILGGEIEKIVEKKLDEEITRKFVIVKKIKQTPPKFPRGQNKPRLIPLV